jgi:hypothetical protein
MILSQIFEAIKEEKSSSFVYTSKENLQKICKEDVRLVSPWSTTRIPTFVIHKDSKRIHVCKVIGLNDNGYLCSFENANNQTVCKNRFMMEYFPHLTPSKEELLALKIASENTKHVDLSKGFSSHLSHLLFDPMSIPTNNIHTLVLGFIDGYCLDVLISVFASNDCKITNLKIEFNQVTHRLFSFIHSGRSRIKTLMVEFNLTESKFNVLPDECFTMMCSFQSSLCYLLLNGYFKATTIIDILAALKRPTLLRHIKWKSNVPDIINKIEDFNEANNKVAILEVFASCHGRVGMCSDAKTLPKDLQKYLKTFL